MKRWSLKVFLRCCLIITSFSFYDGYAQEIVYSCPFPTQLNLFIAGTGVVGKALLEQLAIGHDYFLKTYGVNAHLVGIANTRYIIVDPNGISLSEWQAYLSSVSSPASWENYVAQLLSCQKFNLIFVDCTSSQEIADTYPLLLEKGISIVTPNKKANSGSFEQYQRLKLLAQDSGASYFYDANVGVCPS